LPQLLVGSWLHMPAPLQNDWGWNVVPVHITAMPHVTVVAACAQPPLPSHLPVLPQGGLAAHCPDGADVPAASAVHVPGVAPAQVWQVPQLVLPGGRLPPQQTPSMQLPLPH
jgi:hypothetical protein